jgi:uracil permease
MMQRKIIQVEEKVPILQGLPLSFQHLFAMFGASILVPILFNTTAQKAAGDPNIQVIDPALVLLLNGIGTLIYLFICKRRAPAFLGSSFAFLMPAFAVIASSTDVKANFLKALGGFILCGLIFRG